MFNLLRLTSLLSRCGSIAAQNGDGEGERRMSSNEGGKGRDEEEEEAEERDARAGGDVISLSDAG